MKKIKNLPIEIMFPIFILIISIITILFSNGDNSNNKIGVNDEDILIADETYWIESKDDKYHRSLIYTENEYYRDNLDDFEGIIKIGEEKIDSTNWVYWYLITDTTLSGQEIIAIIDNR